MIASKFNVPLEKIIEMNQQMFIKPKSKFFELTPISLPLCAKESKDHVGPKGVHACLLMSRL
jgi:hypothetical protein